MWPNSYRQRGDPMSATADLNKLILDTVIEKSIDNIDVLSLTKADGEYFRKPYQNKLIVSPIERKYEFYLNDIEGIGDVTKMSLYGNGASIELGDGTEMAEQAVTFQKTGTQSLLIYWSVKVVS